MYSLRVQSTVCLPQEKTEELLNKAPNVDALLAFGLSYCVQYGAIVAHGPTCGRARFTAIKPINERVSMDELRLYQDM